MARCLTLIMIICLLGLPLLGKAEGGEVTTLQIAQDTLASTLNNSCTRWKITGLCFWLECDPFCSVNTTLKVDHYLPDFVVSVYRKYKTNAWKEADSLLDPAAHAVGQQQVKSLLQSDLGQGNQSAASAQEQDNHFKEVDVVGNPALTFFKELPKMYLPSQAQPFMPYYLSLTDAYIWRSPLIETALHPVDTLTPGKRIVGSLFNNWGSVFPRNGFLNQPADAKGAAVIAQRAADIVASQQTSSVPHIAKSLSSAGCGEQCTVNDVKENDAGSALWQMVYPESEKSCGVFGSNDFPGRPWRQEAFAKGKGNYIWILWRHYRGCIQGRGWYLGST